VKAAIINPEISPNSEQKKGYNGVRLDSVFPLRIRSNFPGNVRMAARYMTPMSNIVEAINCIFRLNYIFYTWLTLKM